MISRSSSLARERRLLVYALLGLLELTVTARRATPTIGMDFYEKPPFLAQFLTAKPGEPPPRFYPATRDDRIPRAFEQGYGEGYWEFDKERLRANLATVWGLEQLHNYNPGKLAWWNAYEAFLELELNAEERTLELYQRGVEWVTSPTLLENPALELVATASVPAPGAQYLYRFRKVLPRYQLARDPILVHSHGQALHVGGSDLILRQDGPSIEPEDFRVLDDDGTRRSLSVEGSSAREIKHEFSREGRRRAATLIASSARRVELELPETVREGDYLLARDTYEPRWKAYVDGVETPVLRANFVFRAVKLPAGAKRVVFEYDASFARACFALQTVSWLVLALGLAATRRRSAKPPGA